MTPLYCLESVSIEISSAGLRTLLIMQKELKENRVKVTGAAQTVLDIFNQTGFSDILEVN